MDTTLAPRTEQFDHARLMHESSNRKPLTNKEVKEDPEKALRRVSEEFAGIFYYRLLQVARNDPLKNEFGHGGKGEERFAFLGDWEMGKTLASSQQDGLADLVYKALSAQSRLTPARRGAPADPTTPVDTSNDIGDRTDPGLPDNLASRARLAGMAEEPRGIHHGRTGAADATPDVTRVAPPIVAATAPRDDASTGAGLATRARLATAPTQPTAPLPPADGIKEDKR